MTEDIRKEVLSQLKSIVGDVNVQVEERVDETLLGGFFFVLGTANLMLALQTNFKN